ncbi:MAG: DUF4332 domain-containing protein [Candidatus Thorarchaeota archaeon]
MDPFLLLLLFAPVILGVVCSSKSKPAAGEVISSAKTVKEEQDSEEYVPEVEEPKAKLVDLPIETIEGIGKIYGEKLRAAGISSVEDLLATGTLQVSKICGVSQEVAAKWQAMSRFCWLDGISEEDSEAIVAIGITQYGDLANADPGEILSKVTSAVADGTVEVPEGYEFTYAMVEQWIASVKKFIETWEKLM